MRVLRLGQRQFLSHARANACTSVRISPVNLVLMLTDDISLSTPKDQGIRPLIIYYGRDSKPSLFLHLVRLATPISLVACSAFLHKIKI